MSITVSFMLGTYYLYQYWINGDLEGLFKNSPFKKIEKTPKINKQAYENAYKQNTNFANEVENGEKRKGTDSLEKSSHRVHNVYAFHEPKTLDSNLFLENGKEDRVKKQVDTANHISSNQDGTGDEDKGINSQFRQIKQGGMIMPELEESGGFELIKAPVVIGENVIQQMEVSDLTLDLPAIRVRDIDAIITDLETEVIRDKVIIQGTLHKQIFYVGEDNIIHHQSEEKDFSYYIDIPGAEPGMDVMLEPSVENVVFRLTFEGARLNHKIILQFFVKVLSQQQLIVETGKGPLVKAERVIGENTGQAMLMTEIFLATQALEIIETSAEVIDLKTEVVDDKVLVQGVLHKQLFYIGEDKVEHHQVEDMPFNEFIDIPGAEEGMNVQLHSSVEYVRQKLNPDGTKVTQEIILELFVKVTEDIQINIATGDDSLVMLPEVIGENVKQFLSESKLKLNQSVINIKDITATFEDVSAVVINDRVVVQGIINKQIIYTGENNIEQHQAENTPFTTFVDVIGARPGMSVDVLPSVTYIKHELEEGGTVLSQKVLGDVFVKVTEKIQFKVREVGPYEE